MFILSIFILASSLLCLHEGRKFYTERQEKGKTTPKVYDIGHKFLPDLSEVQPLHIVSDIMCLLPILLPPVGRTKFFKYFLVIMAIRAVFILATILPKDKKCKDEITIMTFVTGHCYDKVFSGHFASVLLFSLLYNMKMDKVIMLNTFNAFLILSTRRHYTVDILVSLFVTLFVYQNLKQ